MCYKKVLIKIYQFFLPPFLPFPPFPPFLPFLTFLCLNPAGGLKSLFLFSLGYFPLILIRSFFDKVSIPSVSLPSLPSESL